MSKKFIKMLEFYAEEMATVEKGINDALIDLQADPAVRVDYIHTRRDVGEISVSDFVTITYRRLYEQ